MMRMLLRRIHNKLLYASANKRICGMKKEDVDSIFRKHHFKFSLKLIIILVIICVIGTYYDASISSLTITFFGCVIVLIINLFKEVLTELFTTSNSDEPLN